MPIDPVFAPVFVVDDGVELADAEADGLAVRDLLVHEEAQVEVIEFLFSERVRPPDARVAEVQLRKRFRAEEHLLGLMLV